MSRQERGWPGHHILGDRCVFHRHTLVTGPRGRVRVSTVGELNWNLEGRLPHHDQVGYARRYETMAFPEDEHGEVLDWAEISGWSRGYNDRTAANEGHDRVVDELERWLSEEAP